MHKIKWLLSGLAIIGSLAFSSVTAYAQTTGVLTGNNVRVRSTPCLDNNDNILFQVSTGELVQILDIEGDFYRVIVRDYSSVYIFREFVTEHVEAERDYYEADYNEDSYNDTDHQEYEYTQADEEDYIYIYDQEVPTWSGDLAEEIIAYAKTYIGTPYRFGSTDPNRGFDCSGFVTVVMRRFGISLQRSSSSMAATNGSYVARDALQPGDLVFFATGGGSRISHVGIYIGGNRFIHSATCSGVIISGMNDPGYRGRYIRANRVF